MAELTLEQQKAVAKAKAKQKASAMSEERGMLSPLFRKSDGSYGWAMPQIALDIGNAIQTPGRALSGDYGLQEMPDGTLTTLTDETIGDAAGLAAMATPASPATRASGLAIMGRKMPDVEPPTAENLLRAGGKGFDAMRASGAEYPASAVKQWAETLIVQLNQKGYNEETAPATIKTLRKLANPPEGGIADITGLHSARKTFGNIGQNFNQPTDQGAASQAIRGLDEFIGGFTEAGIVDDTATAARKSASDLLGEANANYAAGKRSDLVQGIERAADLRAAAANSGKNTGNAIRQRVASALLKEKDTAGFSAAEKDALEEIVRGTFGPNFTRDIANILGGGGGLGSAFAAGLGGAAGTGVGAMVGSPIAGGAVGAAMPMLAGALLKRLSNNMTKRALTEADEALRKRSPLYEAMLKNAQPEPIKSVPAEALARALLASTAQQSGGGGY